MYSIVIPSYNEGEHIAGTVEAVKRTTPARTYEIIVVDDGSIDNSTKLLAGARVLRSRVNRGVIAARNAGAMAAKGETLVFLDAHTYPHDGTWLIPKLSSRITDGLFLTGGVSSYYHPEQGTGYGAHMPHGGLQWEWLFEKAEKEVPVCPGGFMAVTKKTFFEAGAFDPGFRGWGLEDAELSLRAWLFGHRLMVIPDSVIAHVHSEADASCPACNNKRPFPTTGDNYYHNVMRMALLHLDPARIEKVRQKIGREIAAKAERQVLKDPSFHERRQWVLARRKHDIHWYARKFNMKW